jgi:predicted N-acetyltransferase YhbS
MNSETPLTIAVLSREHDRTAFDCGTAELNAYLARYALQNQKKHAARTYVALRENRVVGYYTLTYGSVSHDEAPPPVAAGMPHYPIPVILLARLAVDVSEKGKGLGAGLLKDALLRTVQAADIAGLRAMLVHAKDDAAKTFYEKYGFAASPHFPRHLFLSTAQIIEILK